MTTKQIMLDEIDDDTDRQGTDDTAIGTAIDQAIRHYQPQRFWFNETRTATFNTVASTDAYTWATIGTEFYTIDRAVITIGSGDVRTLDPVSFTDQEEYADEDTTTGEPSEYAITPTGLRLWRSPDDAYAVRLLGHVKLAGPATAAEADNKWMTEAYDLIKCRAKAELYAHRWEDPNGASLMRAAELDALARLRAAHHGRAAQGFLTATEF